MIYKGSKDLRILRNSKGEIIKTMTDEQVISMINTSFGLKRPVTRVILV